MKRLFRGEFSVKDPASGMVAVVEKTFRSAPAEAPHRAAISSVVGMRVQAIEAAEIDRWAFNLLCGEAMDGEYLHLGTWS